jgi:hypothetical protein
MSALMDKGPDAALKALQDAPKVGTIRTPGSLAYDLHYARHVPGPEGSERIVLATDRPISNWEARQQPRSIDYPFTVIEIHLNKDGQGEGKMSIATRVVGDKENHIITLENYDISPVQLNNVHVTK